MLCSLSTKMGEEKLASIQALEKEVGHTLLAFNCHDLKPAQLSENQLQKIKDNESRLGVVLVAVQ